MLQDWVIFLISFAYLGLLFAVAYYGDRRASAGRSIISNPYIYALSMAVYCTAWTFYGSVGRAADRGLDFLPIYLGPTLMAALWLLIMRKIIRISKLHHITSIADLISMRYGKHTLLSGVVTVIAVMGIVPYIALQLKAISTSFQVLSQYPEIHMPGITESTPVFLDTGFYITLILVVFAILFGTRHIDATERHEGLVAAIAFESMVKLVAFLAVGVFVTYGIYNGFGDLFSRAAEVPDIARLFDISQSGTNYADWVWLTMLSMAAILFLPRQFQVAVVENVNEKHLEKAVWLFPLYLLIINVFVLPIAIGGMLQFPGSTVDADTYVLTLPMAMHNEFLAMFVFLGGLSAATSMVIVATIALSIMICNDLVIPVLLRIKRLRLNRRSDLRLLLLFIRRFSIFVVLIIAYFYFRIIGEYYSLVSIGLMSFAAVAQFAPAALGGIFWRNGTRLGAISGLLAGFMVWLFTLPFPSLIEAGYFSRDILTNGLFGLGFLRPTALFGMAGLDWVSHSLFWSMMLNAGLYFGVSLYSRPTPLEHNQAALFVDVYRYTDEMNRSSMWRGEASFNDLELLLRRFLGKKRTNRALEVYSKRREIDLSAAPKIDADFINYVERLLTGTVGSASARVMISSIVKEEPVKIDEVMNILDETQQVIAYSRELEKKSRELQQATIELQRANRRLKELDRFKDDFISTITHELRTPLTSIRAFTEILHDNPDIEPAQRQNFLGIIIKESERLTRLINQILDLQKMESEEIDRKLALMDIRPVIDEAIKSTSQLLSEKRIELALRIEDTLPAIDGDHDHLMQVMLNLISNAVKFCPDKNGKFDIRVYAENGKLIIRVADNGIGIDEQDQKLIFEKFRQVQHKGDAKPPGSGLGLSITRRIIEHHSGSIRVISKAGEGATFIVEIPARPIDKQDSVKNG
jgi:Na+/proline symporter/signal transduction histidine kinase